MDIKKENRGRPRKYEVDYKDGIIKYRNHIASLGRHCDICDVTIKRACLTEHNKTQKHIRNLSLHPITD